MFLFSIAAKVSLVLVSTAKGLTVKVIHIEETKEELPSFTVTFEDDLALLQVSES